MSHMKMTTIDSSLLGRWLWTARSGRSFRCRKVERKLVWDRHIWQKRVVARHVLCHLLVIFHVFLEVSCYSCFFLERLADPLNLFEAWGGWLPGKTGAMGSVCRDGFNPMKRLWGWLIIGFTTLRWLSTPYHLECDCWVVDAPILVARPKIYLE